MRQAHSSSTIARLSQVLTLRIPSRALRGTVAALAFALLVGVAGVALALAGQPPSTGHRSAPLPAVAAAPDYNSDLGTEFDPFVIENSRVRYRSLAPAPDYTSDLGTDYDPFVIANSQHRYVSLAPPPDYTSDLGTEYDPFVIANSRPRYTGSGQGATDDGGPCHTPGRSCNR